MPCPPRSLFPRLALLAGLLAGSAAAEPFRFADVPSTHWARGAIEASVSRGILQGYDGRFSGERLVNRYQLAVVVSRLLEESRKAAEQVARATGGVAALGETQATLIEMAEELGGLSARCESLARQGETLRSEVAALRDGSFSRIATTPRSAWRHRRWAGQTL